MSVGSNAAGPAARAVVPTYSETTMRLFELGFSRWRARRLHTRVLDMPHRMLDDVPLVFVANHTSWWDGFLIRDIQRYVRPGRSLYSVMTAEELRRNPFLRRIGAVPLDPQSTSSTLALLRALQDVTRAERGACITWFPQGRIAPAWQRPLDFRRGIELLVRAIGPCWLLPVGIHIEPLNRAAPTAFVSAGTPVRAIDRIAVEDLEDAVRRRLDRIADVLVNPDDAARRLEYA